MKERVGTGIGDLDSLIGGLYVGDNVIWYDDAGSLSDVFYLNLIRSSLQDHAPLIYVSFDRSLKNLIEKLGPLAQSSALTIIDCFTYGKGNGADIFVDYQKQVPEDWPGTLLTVKHPDRMEEVADTFYEHHDRLDGTVRFIFESLTGMQDLWGGEDQLVSFYVRTCPRLYDLNTIAYWLIEKEAHSGKLRAQINQIAQVVVDLAVQRGKTSLRIIKAENRSPDRLDQPLPYFSKETTIRFGPEDQSTGKTDLGARIRAMRTQANLSQTELAKRVGVTPSSISQIESGLIYPSLPALFRMADVFSADMGDFFQSGPDKPAPVIIGQTGRQATTPPDMVETGVRCWRVPEIEAQGRLIPGIIEIPPRTTLPAHFHQSKGDEIGYLLEGRLVMTYRGEAFHVAAGDFIHMADGWPASWENPGKKTARLLWLVATRS